MQQIFDFVPSMLIRLESNPQCPEVLVVSQIGSGSLKLGLSYTCHRAFPAAHNGSTHSMKFVCLFVCLRVSMAQTFMSKSKRRAALCRFTCSLCISLALLSSLPVQHMWANGVGFISSMLISVSARRASQYCLHALPQFTGAATLTDNKELHHRGCSQVVHHGGNVFFILLSSSFLLTPLFISCSHIRLHLFQH